MLPRFLRRRQSPILTPDAIRARYGNATPQRIAIVGSGLAGLSAAYLLSQLGHDVTVLEASDQPGGRAATLRRGFTAGLSADAGGFRYHNDHILVTQYVKSFGLAVGPFYPKEGLSILYLDGTRILRTPGQPVNPAQLAKPLTDLNTWIFRQETDFEASRILAGADALPIAFAQRLEGRIRFHSPVTAIEQDPAGTCLACSVDGHSQPCRVDRVICAVPFSMMPQIRVSPPLSAPKRRVISRLPYASACLVFFEVPQVYFSSRGLTGFAVTDTLGEIWNLADQNASDGILVCYARHELAKYFNALSEQDRFRETLARLDHVFPGIGDHVGPCATKSWDNDEWVRGAQSRAWELSRFAAWAARRVEGRIHFAGEHTATAHHGWMEGALESGHRAATEVHSRSASH